jgi:hypothetical protein
LVSTNFRDLGEKALVMSVESTKILNGSGEVLLDLDDLKGLIDDNLLEEWNDSNFLFKISYVLFKNNDFFSLNLACVAEHFVLISELLILNLVHVELVKSCLELVPVVLESFDVNFPILILNDVSDELVVLVLEVVVVVGATVKLGSQCFAVFNESVENIHVWIDCSADVEALKNNSDSLLLS